MENSFQEIDESVLTFPKRIKLNWEQLQTIWWSVENRE